MSVLYNKIPPVIIVLIFSMSVWGISLFSAFVVTNPFILELIALTIFILGLLFAIAGVVSFRLARTTTNPLKPESASALVNTGIYAISRNPMYVGFAFFLLSQSVYLASPMSVIGLVGFILYMNEFQIKPEEKHLAEIFGADFADYKHKVRRWL
ncbi:methyltransferase family protein [Shewanella donghaensis]|uniref:methyltransferase family protein n=1 Tax=Shewanella donghaensis TaxID=238836 RepID=UPI0011834C8F|nr:isoprenylcysteine carboxylmethyltransferase family protein [Shewanella donghaensis]